MNNLLQRILLLAVLGIVVSLYLVYHHENIVGGYNIGQSFCNIGGNFNCDEVAKSNYSSIFGLPVAAFGLCYFVFLSVFSLYTSRRSDNQQVAVSLIGISTLIALVPSIFLLLVSIFQIKKFCLFCLLLDLVIVTILIVSAKSIKLQYLSQAPAFLSSIKAFIAIVLPLTLIFSFFTPWAFRNFVLEAALKSSVIGKIYQEWQNSPLREFEFKFAGDGLEKDYYLGASNPKVTLVEFSDFQCPFCKLASKEVKTLVNKWPNELRVVFKNFPLDKLCNLRFQQAPHQLSCQAAVMARCAGLQGDENFWRFHDSLFALEYEQWSVEHLIKIPQELNLAQVQIDKCVAEGNALTRVRADVELGNDIGLDSTPSFFINGRKVSLGRLDQLEKLIEMILAK